MTRAFDFVVTGVIWIIAAVIHLIGIELFAPGTPLFAVATDGTAAMSGQARAEFWYEILALWVPLMAAVGITVWAAIREYRRQVATAMARVP